MAAVAAPTGAKNAPAKVGLPRRRSVSQICPPARRPMTLGDLYPGCENERLGVARESMLQNHLIAKTEIGKPRRSNYTLPGYDFSYGLYLHGMDGGVPEAICHWHVLKPRIILEKEKPRDYMTTNVHAVKDGYVTAHEQNLYRKMKDFHVNIEDERRFKRTPPKVPPDMTYGRPARPSTPFFDLLQHKYREIWMDEQRAVIKAEKAEKKQKKRRGKFYETRTCLLRKFQPPMKKEDLWRIPHFQKPSAASLASSSSFHPQGRISRRRSTQRAFSYREGQRRGLQRLTHTSRPSQITLHTRRRLRSSIQKFL